MKIVVGIPHIFIPLRITDTILIPQYRIPTQVWQVAPGSWNSENDVVCQSTFGSLILSGCKALTQNTATMFLLGPLAQLKMLFHRHCDVPGAGQAGWKAYHVTGTKPYNTVRGGHLNPSLQQVADFVGIVMPIEPGGLLFPDRPVQHPLALKLSGFGFFYIDFHSTS